MGKATLEAREAESASEPSVTNITDRLLSTRLMQRGDPDARLYRGVK